MIVVSETQHLLSSIDQMKLLLVDTRRGALVSELIMDGYPQQICLVGDNSVAAAVSNSKIQFLKVCGNTLLRSSTLDVEGKIAGIATYGNNLVTSYTRPPGVKIINMDGSVIHKQDNETTGRQLFIKPLYQNRTGSS